MLKFLFFYFLKFSSGRNYLITAPEVFHGGVGENISVAIFDYEDPIHISIKLEIRGNIISTASGEIQKRGIINLLAPTGVQGKARLTICGNCHLQTGYVFTNETSVTISPRGTIAMIKTDKDIYKPGQTVRMKAWYKKVHVI